MDAGTVSHEVYFVTFHPGGAEHLLAYAHHLKSQEMDLGIVAADSAYAKMVAGSMEATNMLAGRSVKELKKLPASELEEVYEEVFKIVQSAKIIFFDLGHSFSGPIIKLLKERTPGVKIVGCYDNPEPFVPGEYSENVGKVAKEVHYMVFANENFCLQPIYEKEGQICEYTAEKRATGFYPMSKITELVNKRLPDTRESAKNEFLKKYEVEHEIETLAVLVGGANSVYFESAFPNFLQMMSKASSEMNLSKITIIFQQHPRAVEDNRDGEMLLKWVNESATPRCPHIIFSKEPTSGLALQIADVVFYHQTSESPTYPLVEIPCIQVGKRFNDLVVSNGAGFSAETPSEFLLALTEIKRQSATLNKQNRDRIIKALGYRENWRERLSGIIKELLQPENK